MARTPVLSSSTSRVSETVCHSGGDQFSCGKVEIHTLLLKKVAFIIFYYRSSGIFYFLFSTLPTGPYSPHTLLLYIFYLFCLLYKRNSYLLADCSILQSRTNSHQIKPKTFWIMCATGAWAWQLNIQVKVTFNLRSHLSFLS